MLTYWVLFAFFACGVLLSRPGGPLAVGPNAAPLPGPRPAAPARPLIAVGALAIAVLVGLRYKVGADWVQYEFIFQRADRLHLDTLLGLKDPGYQLLNWAANQANAEVWLVNLVCGFIFSWGLLRLARNQPDPWLAMAIAVPYLVVVVAMGYTRQAVAIGIIMAGLASVERGGSLLRYAGYVAVAALFHRTAVVGLLLVLIAGERSRLLKFLFGVAIFILFYDLFIDDEAEEYFVRSYIEREYGSEGALIRLVMNIVPAGLFILFRNRFGFTDRQKGIWLNFSIAAFGLFLMLFLSPSSTAVDRLALYVVPLQVVVLSRVPGTLVRPQLGRVMVLAYSFAILFTWLNFASHADAWVPYRLYPFD